MTAIEARQTWLLRPTALAAGGEHSADAVETDPSQRYLRYSVLLGRGACKRVYKAFDQTEGIEVAWNQVDLGSNMDQESRERLFSEIHVLKSLKHRNIMSFFDWWYDAGSQTINFITEYFTSGNLRQYRKKHKLISEQAIKRWAFQILEGLLYLHAHDPPIVHRDLKCDNILVNGTSGQVKIADLGLASCQRGLSVVGTPEFMAPEMYDEVYDEKVDIYSFGMCMLELATLEYPYSECRSIPAIFRKVSQGIPPAALSKGGSQPLRDFITLCINPSPAKRPSALYLLKHDFFDSLKQDTSNQSSPTHAAKGGCFGLPFGSCGNLQALSSSHASSSHHARSLRAGASASRSGKLAEGTLGTVCAVCSSSAAAATDSHAAAAAVGLQAAAAALTVGSMPNGAVAISSTTASRTSAAHACVFADSSCKNASVGEPSRSAIQPQQQQPKQQGQDTGKSPLAPGACIACGAAVGSSSSSSGSSGAEKCPAARPERLNLQLLEDKAEQGVSYVHGTTVCLAALGKSTTNDSGEDSDDEVLVALEDVLTPHPEDLLDPETYHLHSQITHAGSGCMVMSHPGCPIASGADIPLESRLSGFHGFHGLVVRPEASGLSGSSSAALSGLLSRYASTVAAQQQQQQQQMQQQLKWQGQASLQDAPSLAAAVAAERLGDSSPPLAVLCESPISGIEHRSTFTFCSTGDAAAEQLRADAQCASCQQTCAGAAAAAAMAAGTAGSGSQRASQTASSRRSSSACDVPTSSFFVHEGRAAAAAAAARSGASSSSGSILSTSAPLFSFRSEAALASSGGFGGRLGEPSRQLLRTISNSNHRRNAGALAAAGLLQMSPGLYLTTPPLLGKLLSKKAVQINGSSSVGGGSQCCHAKEASNDSLAGWDAYQLSLNSATLDQPLQQQQQRQDLSSGYLTASCRASGCGAVLAVSMAVAQAGAGGNVWPQSMEHREVSAELGGWQVEEDAAAASTAQDGPTAAPCAGSSLQLGDDPLAAAFHLSSEGPVLPLLLPAAAVRLAAANALSGSILSSPAAAASPVGGAFGGFGKILVRRRFARNLQPVVLSIQRSVSV